MRPPKNKAADHAVDFINNLTLTGDFSGQQFLLRRWQEDKIIRPLFGTLDKSGRRSITKSCWLLPRKQGKSSLAAAVLIYALINFPPGQQIYSVGRDRGQAAEIFNLAQQMLRQDPELMEAFGIEILDSTKRITIPSRHSFYAALSKEHKGNKLGKNPSLLLFDEAQDLDEKMHAALTTGMASRTKNPPLIIYIMTGGERKNGLAWEISEEAKKIDQGIIEAPNFHTALWYAKDEEEDQWDDPKLWRRVIPALGDFCSEKFFEDEAERARRLSRLQADFKRFYLNITQSPSTAWIHDSDWMKNAEPPIGCTEMILGFDGASVNDTSSAVLFGKNKEGTYDVIPTIWVCQRQIDERNEAKSDYPQWQKDGYLEVTPGEAQDQEQIFADILELCSKYPVRKIALDRYGMQWMGPKLMNALPEIDIRAVSQGIVSISEPLKQIEKLALNGKLRHGGHPVMRWQNTNAKVYRDHSGNIRIDKRDAEPQDSIQALGCAASLYDFTELAEESSKSCYEDRGIFVL